MDQARSGAAIGLDIGTSRIVMAREVGGDKQYQSQLNAFVTIPYSKITAGVLKREGVPHTVNGTEITVFGNESERFADLLSVETRRPMTRGLLNPNEPESLALMRQIIQSLLGDGKADQGSKVYFSVPAPLLGSNENTYHEATLRQMLEEMGFHAAQPINEGLAVIYAELEESNYTGIGISCGGGLCNVCLAYLSVPVLSFSIGKAGDFIDSSAASVSGETANRVRIAKESGFQFSPSYSDKTHQVLSVYYDDMIQSLVSGLKEAFATAKTMPKLGRTLPLVLSGGTTMPKGFRDRFEHHLRAADFQLSLSEVRLAQSPQHTTAKGALMAALTED